MQNAGFDSDPLLQGLEQARMFRDERSKVNIVCVNEGEESKMTADEQEVSICFNPLVTHGR